MALLDLVTLPARLAVAAADTTLALGELVRADGPVRRPGGTPTGWTGRSRRAASWTG
jgi:hypothetical protein